MRWLVCNFKPSVDSPGKVSLDIFRTRKRTGNLGYSVHRKLPHTHTQTDAFMAIYTTSHPNIKVDLFVLQNQETRTRDSNRSFKQQRIWKNNSMKETTEQQKIWNKQKSQGVEQNTRHLSNFIRNVIDKLLSCKTLLHCFCRNP